MDFFFFIWLCIHSTHTHVYIDKKYNENRCFCCNLIFFLFFIECGGLFEGGIDIDKCFGLISINFYLFYLFSISDTIVWF